MPITLPITMPWDCSSSCPVAFILNIISFWVEYTTSPHVTTLRKSSGCFPAWRARISTSSVFHQTRPGYPKHVSCLTAIPIAIIFHVFIFYPPADARRKSSSSPHFHVFSYVSCAKLSRLYSQPSARWRMLRFPCGSDSASCPPLLLHVQRTLA